MKADNKGPEMGPLFCSSFVLFVRNGRTHFNIADWGPIGCPRNITAVSAQPDYGSIGGKPS